MWNYYCGFKQSAANQLQTHSNYKNILVIGNII